MSRHSARGFTLVELLVALAIFALVAAFAYRSLAAMLETRQALERETRKWRDASLLVGRLERDLAAVLDRVARGSSGTELAPVSSALRWVVGGTASGKTTFMNTALSLIPEDERLFVIEHTADGRWPIRTLAGAVTDLVNRVENR